MKKQQLVSIIIPTLNEEEAIGQVLRSIPYRDLGPIEVIVVDGGSADGTVEVAKALGANVVKQSKPGYGQAILEGISRAKGDLLVLVDGDGVYDLREIPYLLKVVESQDADIVIGSRFRGEIKPGSMPMIRYLMNRLFNYLLGIFLPIQVADLMSGFRVAKKTSLLRLKNQLREPVQYSMILSAFFNKMKVIEVPITFYPRIGRSKLSSSRAFFTTLGFLLKLRIWRRSK
jgi:glycosyltransferase involved in cell wall biosynthesis